LLKIDIIIKIHLNQKSEMIVQFLKTNLICFFIVEKDEKVPADLNKVAERKNRGLQKMKTETQL